MTLFLESHVLEEAGRFFEECGSIGCEGTAMIMANKAGVAYRLIIPDQESHPVPHCWVEVTRAGKSELIVALGPNDRYVSRIHSHPGLAFHSAADDANPALTQEGALSIVAPYFGLGLRQGLDTCAVFTRRGQQWAELPPGPERDVTIEVVS